MEPETEVAPDPVSIVCLQCTEENLTDKIFLAHCTDCNRLYCRHRASVVDSNYCSDCLSDVTLTVEKIHVVETVVSPKTGNSYTKTQTGRRITLGGAQWLFHQRRIKDLTEDELELTIQYHFTTYIGLIKERDQRKAEHMRRNAKKLYKVSEPLVPAPTSSTTKTTTKTTKTTKPIGHSAKIQAMMAQMAAMGLSAEDLLK
jgi:hypothetical protein